LGTLLAAPAQAKCCPLNHLIVIVPGFGDIQISAAQLDSQLHPAEQGNLYWPVLNGSSKGDDRPIGNLGPRHYITYVLEDSEGNSVQVREKVYLEADPPVAFAPKGQTAELLRSDEREVPWGWRPFPERAANAISFLIDETIGDSSGASSLAGDLILVTSRSWWARFGAWLAAAFVATAGALWFFLRRRRPIRTDSAGS
jgi:hypothetical protein